MLAAWVSRKVNYTGGCSHSVILAGCDSVEHHYGYVNYTNYGVSLGT